MENPYSGTFADLAYAIDRFWADTLRSDGFSYVAPGVIPLDRLLNTGCGPAGPERDAFYCPIDSTIYLSPYFLADKDRIVGDYAPITVLAHEWGHHIQFLTGAPNPGGNTFELQADCLAGVYTQHAATDGLLDPGDITEAVTISGDAGDPVGLPQDQPGAHGTNDDRITAFMRGYLNGLDACALPTTGGGTVAGPLTSMLPGTLPLPHAACFRVEGDGVLSFDELAARLGGTDQARQRLDQWGWQASAFKTFACDWPPEGEAGWIDMGIHLFRDAAAAQQAVDYFAAARADGTRLVTGAPPVIGDHAVVLSGPTTNGNEFTLYASHGPLLVRVTGVSPAGIPFANVLTVASALLTAPLPVIPPPTPGPTIPTQPAATLPAEQPTPAVGVASYLPVVLPLAHAACFHADEPVVYDFAFLLKRFPGVPDAAATLRDLGWQEGAYRQFSCANPPPLGFTTWIDVSVHRFKDAPSATAASLFYASTRALGTQLASIEAPDIGDTATALAGPSDAGRDYTLYVTHGPLLLRVTGVAPNGDPQPDVEQVMRALYSSVVMRGEPGGGTTTTPTTTDMEPSPAALPTQVGRPSTYTLTDLGTGNGNWSTADRINDQGQVLWSWGSSQDPFSDVFHDPHSELWSGGSSTDLSRVGITSTIAINDSGTILGRRGLEPVILQAGSSTLIPLPIFKNGSPSNISNTGVMVGTVNGNGAVVSSSGIVSLLIPEGFKMVVPTAINAAGLVAGRAVNDPLGGPTQRAILSREGDVLVLGQAPGADSSLAVDINDVGQIVGGPGASGMHTVQHYGRAFVYDSMNETMTDLGTLPGYQNSVATAINNLGQIVGYAWYPVEWESGDSLQRFRRAFIYDMQTGKMTDLNDLLSSASGWDLVLAEDINDLGQIVGRGWIDGQMHAFLLAPSP